MKPCPFCGAVASDGRKSYVCVVEVKPECWGMSVLKSDEKAFAVKCLRCGAHGGMGLSGKSLMGEDVSYTEAKEIAVRKWNQRQ